MDKKERYGMNHAAKTKFPMLLNTTKDVCTWQAKMRDYDEYKWLLAENEIQFDEKYLLQEFSHSTLQSCR